MVKWLAVGFLLFTTPTYSVAQILETKFEHNLEPWLALIEDETLEGKIRLDLHFQTSQITVQVRRSTPEEARLHPEMAMQAWILKEDGTSIRRRYPSKAPGPGRTTGWIAIFAFEPAKLQELAAVVLSLDGTLFVKPIPHESK